MNHKKIQFLLIFINFFLYIFSCNKTQNNKQEFAGKIIFSEGNVMLNKKPIQDQNQLISWKDVIETGENSKVRFIIKDGLIIQLNQNSVFSMDHENNIYKLNLQKGWIAAVKNNDGNQMDIITPTAIASVRGTSLCFKVESEQSVYGCTCNGTIHWHTKDGKTLQIESIHHNASRFIDKQGSIEIQKASLEYHDDTIIEDLAKIIHHELNWK